MPTLDLNASAVTPDRGTEIVFNIPTYALRQKPWRKTWRGAQLADAPSPDGDSATFRVMMLPNGTWMLESVQWRMSFDSPDGTLGHMIPSSLFFNLAPDHATIPLGTSAVPDTGGPPEISSYFIVKQIAAGATDWHRELTADAAAFPKPAVQAAGEIDRVAQGKVTFRKNQPFCVRFISGERLGLLSDPILTFYFGGPSDIVVQDPFFGTRAGGGEFALTWFMSGIYELWQKTRPDEDQPWVRMWQSYWAFPVGLGGTHTFYIIPDGHDYIWVTSDAGEARGSQAPGQNNRAVKIPASATGYTGKSETTGPGIVRMDVRRWSRVPWQAHFFTYAAGSGSDPEGWLRGPIFELPWPVPADTKLFVDLDKEEEAFTSIVPRVFSVPLNDELTQNPDGSFNTLAGITRYRILFEFRVNDAGEFARTPRLRGATVRMDGVVSPVQPVPFLPLLPTAWQVTGPTNEPDIESALVDVEDPIDVLAEREDGNGGLAVNADTHFVIQTSYDPEDSEARVVLFSGILKRAPAALWGNDGGDGQVALGARKYRCAGAGMYARLASPGNTNWARRTYYEDPDAIPDLTGVRPGMRIVDIIGDLLKAGGFDESQYDKPDLDFRLFVNPERRGDYELNPGVRLIDAIDRLCREYLGRYLVWDGNAGLDLPDFPGQPRGMWRLIQPPLYSPVGDYDVKYYFTTQAPVAFTRQVHLPDAYPTATTFVTNLSYGGPDPPEANYVLVYAGTQALISSPEDFFQSIFADPTQRTLIKRIYNPRAVSLDPTNPTEDLTSPDWAGGELKAYIHIDPTLNIDNGGPKTEEAVSFLCRRLFDAMGYGRQPLEWQAPCHFIEDGADPHLHGRRRPLRFGDVVHLNGQPVVLTAANMECPEDDTQQMYTLEGFLPVRPLGYAGANPSGTAFSAEDQSFLEATEFESLTVGAEESFWTAGWVNLSSQTPMCLWGKTIALEEGTPYQLDHEWAVYYRGYAGILPTFTVSSPTGTAFPGALDGNPYSTGVWYFIFGAYDASANTSYVASDDNAVEFASYGGGSQDLGAPFRVGRDEGTTRFADAQMRSIAFGKNPPGGLAAVFDAIRASLFNGGDPKDYADLTAAEKTDWGLVSYWNLTEEFGTRYDSHGGNHVDPSGMP